MRYVQVLDALDFGDAVSNQVLHLHDMLLRRGLDSQIFTKYSNYRVQQYRQPFESLKVSEDVILIHHFAGYSEIADEVIHLRCYKVFLYHNITPHGFFEKGTDLYNFCLKGRLQLRKILSKYDFAIGASLYNCRELEELGFSHCEELPIAVIAPNYLRPSSSAIAQLRQQAEKVWLFVGRIAPNKRQDLVIDAFACHTKLYPLENHHLYLVGRYDENDGYYRQVSSKIKDLNLENKVTLSNKVEDDVLPFYYQAADVFVCMSQHEGFCVPIIEAFNYQLPVVAYASTAIVTTLGDSYGALQSLDVELVAQRVQEIISNVALQNTLKNHGLQQASRFSLESVQERFYKILDQISPQNNSELPLTLSVVICTCNRRHYLERCLNYLKDQDYLHFEVVVVNGPSTDETMSVLNDRYDIKIVQNSKMNLSISRNLGIEQASGDIVAFIDDDALPYTDWAREIVQRYQELPDKFVGVGGRTFFANKLMFQFEDGITDSFGHAISLKTGDPKIHTPNSYRHLLGTNATFRRDALIAVQGFDEQYDYYLDETDLAVRLQQAGGMIATAPKAYVRHEFAQSHNRQGQYNFNWKVIAKNMVYFGIKNAKQDAPLWKRVYKTLRQVTRQRWLDFLNAAWTKKISWREALFHCWKTLLGVSIGYYDCLSERKLRPLASQSPESFLPYLNSQATEPDAHFASSIVNLSLAKVHILIVSQEFPPHSFGGIGTYNQTLAKELIQLGHDVTVISRGPQDSTEVVGPFTHVQVASIPHEDILPQFPVLSKNLAWARMVRKWVEKIHQQRPISIIESAIWDVETIDLLKHKHELKIPIVTRLVTPLKVAIEMNGWKTTADLEHCVEIEKLLVHHTDAVAPISHSIQQSFQSVYGFVPDERWSIQPLGVQPWPSYTTATSYGELPDGLNRQKIQILFVGRLEARKGIDIFLKALKLLMGKELQVGVWVAGKDIEGWRDRSLSLLGKEIYDRVQFFGMVSEEFRELLYANCDFLVFPSRYESFGLVPLEAMAYQKPIIGAAAGAIPEVVINGESGLLFEPDNPQDLAQKILLLIRDEALREKLSQGAKARVEVLSARNMAKSSLVLYQSLIEKCPEHSTSPVLQSAVLDEFEQIADRREQSSSFSKSVSQSLETYPLANSPMTPTKLTNLRSDWDVARPRIIGWGFFNKIANRFIVPKITKFINSVLHPSMQMQSALNRALLSENFQLRNKLDQMASETQSRLDLMQSRLDSMQHQSRESESYLQKSIEALTYLPERVEFIRSELMFEMRYGASSIVQGEKSTKTTIEIISPEKLDVHRAQGIRLNLGCGHIALESYLNVDTRALPGVDIVADVASLPFERSEVSEIFSSHVLEHFPQEELRRKLLPYWVGLLKPGGVFVAIVPDADAMIQEYARGEYLYSHLREVFFGAQDYDGDFHFNMFIPEQMEALFLEAGLSNFEVKLRGRKNGACLEMEVRAYKES